MVSAGQSTDCATNRSRQQTQDRRSERNMELYGCYRRTGCARSARRRHSARQNCALDGRHRRNGQRHVQQTKGKNAAKCVVSRRPGNSPLDYSATIHCWPPAFLHALTQMVNLGKLQINGRLSLIPAPKFRIPIRYTQQLQALTPQLSSPTLVRTEILGKYNTYS